MNALEWADELQDAYCEGQKLTEVANLLRQLQAEIEALKAKTLIDEEIEQLQAEYDIDSGLTCHSVKDFARAIEKRIKNERK